MPLKLRLNLIKKKITKKPITFAEKREALGFTRTGVAKPITEKEKAFQYLTTPTGQKLAVFTGVNYSKLQGNTLLNTKFADALNAAKKKGPEAVAELKAKMLVEAEKRKLAAEQRKQKNIKQVNKATLDSIKNQAFFKILKYKIKRLTGKSLTRFLNEECCIPYNGGGASMNTNIYLSEVLNNYLLLHQQEITNIKNKNQLKDFFLQMKNNSSVDYAISYYKSEVYAKIG